VQESSVFTQAYGLVWAILYHNKLDTHILLGDGTIQETEVKCAQDQRTTAKIRPWWSNLSDS